MSLDLRHLWFTLAAAAPGGAALHSGPAQDPQQGRGATSYTPVAQTEDFAAVMERMTKSKPAVMAQHQRLLEERYDLANRPAGGAAMSRGKALQDGVRVKLPAGATWDGLGALSPQRIREQGLAPGLLSLAAPQPSGRRHGLPPLPRR